METLWKIYRESREDDCAFRKHQCRTIQQEHHKWQHNQYHSHSVKNNWISFVDIVKCIGVSIITNPHATLKYWHHLQWQTNGLFFFGILWCKQSASAPIGSDKENSCCPNSKSRKKYLNNNLVFACFLFIISLQHDHLTEVNVWLSWYSVLLSLNKDKVAVAFIFVVLVQQAENAGQRSNS